MPMKRLGMSMLGLAAFTMVATSAVAPAAAKGTTATKASDTWASVGAKIPSDMKMIFGVSATKIRGLTIFQDFWKEVSADQNVGMALGMVQGSCGFDPIALLDSVVVATDGGSKVGIFVKWAGADETKIEDCISKLAPQFMGGKKLTTAKDGNIVEFSVDGKAMLDVAWPSKDTMLVTSDGQGKDKASLKAFMAGKGPDATLKTGLGFVKTTSLLWGAVSKFDTADEGMQKAKVAGFAIDSKSADELSVSGDIRFDSADVAKAEAAKANEKFAEAIKKLPASASAVATALKGITITAKGKDVLIGGSVKIDKTLGTQLGDLFKQGM